MSWGLDIRWHSVPGPPVADDCEALYRRTWLQHFWTMSNAASATTRSGIPWMTWCRYLICLVPYRWAVWLWLLKRSALVVYTTRLPEKRTGYCRLPQCCLSSNEYSTLRHAHICGFWGSWTQVSFEYYPMINGTWLDSSLGEFFNDLLQHVLLPYVRTAYNCKSCAVGDILIRRSGMEGWPKQMLHIWSCQLTGWWFGTMEFYDFPNIGNNHPNWLSYFSEGLKPPTT